MMKSLGVKKNEESDVQEGCLTAIDVCKLMNIKPLILKELIKEGTVEYLSLPVGATKHRETLSHIRFTNQQYEQLIQLLTVRRSEI